MKHRFRKKYERVRVDGAVKIGLSNSLPIYADPITRVDYDLCHDLNSRDVSYQVGQFDLERSAFGRSFLTSIPRDLIQFLHAICISHFPLRPYYLSQRSLSLSQKRFSEGNFPHSGGQ